jgi:hypothetical protein
MWGLLSRHSVEVRFDCDESRTSTIEDRRDARGGHADGAGLTFPCSAEDSPAGARVSFDWLEAGDERMAWNRTTGSLASIGPTIQRGKLRQPPCALSAYEGNR